MEYWLTADIGGTKLAVAAFDGGGLLARSQCETRAEQGRERVIETLCERLRAVREELPSGRVLGLGIACPGPLAPSQGLVLRAPKLGWVNVPLTRILQERLGLPVRLENDANAAAYAEYRLGAGRDAHSIAYLTISTGVGCGIVVDGQILEGAHEAAGEIGHLVIRPQGPACPCGRQGCLELYASGTAIGEHARRRLPEMPRLDAQTVAVLARQGNQICRRIFAEAGDALGTGIAAIQQLVDVEKIVLGGSVSQAMDLFAPALIRRVRKNSYWGNAPEQWLKAAELGGDSGLLGAGLLAMEQTNNKGKGA